MKLIVGLGNPGEEYKNNRHNAGFMFVDHLVNELASLRVGEFKKDKYSHSELAKLVINNDEIVLCKPQTFMNKSGAAVKSCVKRYALNVIQDIIIIIIHDDLDIPLSKFKIQKGAGPKLHNGIESIERSLRTKDFLRVRIGIDNRQKTGRVDGETYVLQDFLPEEKKLLTTEIFPKIFTRIKLEIF